MLLADRRGIAHGGSARGRRDASATGKNESGDRRLPSACRSGIAGDYCFGDNQGPFAANPRLRIPRCWLTAPKGTGPIKGTLVEEAIERASEKHYGPGSTVLGAEV